MKNIPFIRKTLVFCSLLVFFSCEDSLPDYYLEKEYNLTNFDQVKLGDAFQIEIVQAEEFKVIAKGEERDLNDLILVVEGNLLTGRYRQGSRNHKRTMIQIHLPELKSFEVHSASFTKISGFHDAEKDLTLKVSGAAEAHFTGNARNLVVYVHGASLLSLTGEAENLSAEVHGASELRAKSLKTKSAQIQVHSGSHANVEVQDSITGGVRGGSSFIYYGSPDSVEVSVETGSSMVHGS